MRRGSFLRRRSSVGLVLRHEREVVRHRSQKHLCNLDPVRRLHGNRDDTTASDEGGCERSEVSARGEVGVDVWGGGGSARVTTITTTEGMEERTRERQSDEC